MNFVFSRDGLETSALDVWWSRVLNWEIFVLVFGMVWAVVGLVCSDFQKKWLKIFWTVGFVSNPYYVCVVAGIM